jgi:lipopolysaccharide transport system permease protein
MTNNKKNPEEHLMVFTPGERHGISLWKSWVIIARNIIRARFLIWQLFKRDYFGRFKKSYLGMTWIFISPLAGIISWVFFQQAGLLKPGDVGIPYPAYVLIGTSMWGLFMGFYGAASNTLSAGKGLIMQINFSHEALLFKQTTMRLTNFAIVLVMNLLFLLVFGITPSWKIVFFPLVILPMFFLGASIGLIVSMISIVAVDIKRIISRSMGLLMYATPLIYSDKIEVEWVKTLIKWNPLTYLICSARDIIIYGRLYDTKMFFIFGGISFLMFLISWRLFFVSEKRLIERMI